MTDNSKVPFSRLNITVNNLFDYKWADHILNDVSWLRADTFSWQDGGLYEGAYNHLVSDLGSTTSEVTFYGWEESHGDNVVYTDTASPILGDNYYDENGNILGTATNYDPQWLEAGGTIYDRNSSYDFIGSSASYSATQKTETIGSHTITYYEAADGHKIILPDQEQTAINIYNESGVAWYYILDTTNERFKLPRTKFGVVGLRDSVGKFVEAGLPNITSGTDWVGSTGGTSSDAQNTAPSNDGCFVGKSTGGHGIAGNVYPIYWSRLDASNSNSVYGNSTTVQPPATQMYLYFYVGGYNQDALEQSAGINTELFNGKADVDLSNAALNASTTAKETIVGWGMPDYSAGVSISLPYTVTKKGVISIGAYKAQVGTHYVYINNNKVTGSTNSSNSFYTCVSGEYLVDVGDVFSADEYWNFAVLIFYPMKGIQ